MTFTDKHIIDAYSAFFEGMAADEKLELIRRLSTPAADTDSKKREKNFYKAFGGFVSEKPAEDIISDIKSNRNFKKREAISLR